jgi:hypothetical protein
VKTSEHPWITIIVGLIVLLVTTCYYQSILDDFVIYHGTVELFNIYGWAVVLVGSIFTLWAYFKVKMLSKMWLLISVLTFNILAIYYFAITLKPMPGRVTLKLKNKTESDLTGLLVLYGKELRFDVLEKDKSMDLMLNHYSEDYDIELICKMGNNALDTISLAKHISNSCGYYDEILLKAENGHLTKH